MGSTVTPAIRWLANEMDNGLDYPSAVNSGIIGDLAHNRSGYHFGASDQRDPNNYSVTRVDDRPPLRTDHNAATGIDTSKSTADMVKSWNRVEAVWRNRGSDPRAKYLNAYNGWNGRGQAERLDFVTGARTVTDDSHKWHDHTEVRRRYANDMAAMRAVRSVLAGQSVEQWNASNGGGSAGEDEEMSEDTERRVRNADEAWGYNGLMELKDTVTYEVIEDGKLQKRTVENKLARAIKAMSGAVVNLVDRVTALESRPAVEVALSDDDRADIARRVVEQLGTLRFEPDGNAGQ